ncbi:hypothetical protein [Synechococcus sp. CB0101]|uniref:hypothetical protein n=1 Tax=Synechococcus sp. CB0101 TaxID=232348 RepID=UPI00030662AA|nr:hypothetical protein [Synechococcus sp. CB0101]
MPLGISHTQESQARISHGLPQVGFEGSQVATDEVINQRNGQTTGQCLGGSLLAEFNQ